MSLKALIFDVDGTLANTERDGHLLAFNLAFETLLLDWVWSRELYAKLLAITGGQLRIKYYLAKYKPEFELEAKHKHSDLDSFVASIHALKTQIYVGFVNQGAISLRTGVARLLHEARAVGLRLAIATTTTKANVDAIITNTLGSEALNWFEVIGAGGVVPNLKPAADIYLWVLEKMKLNATDCIAFEDSYNGIISATAANLKSLITVNEYTRSHQFEGAMAVFNHLGTADKPATLIAGEATSHTYITVNYLKELHAKHC